MEKNAHHGHRARMRKRFLKTGFDGFTDHEILELLLFYARPRVDTNLIAHRLVDTFHSLSGVFDANVMDLCKIDGIDEASAVLLKMIPLLSQKYSLSRKNVFQIKSLSEMCSYFQSLYTGKQNEQVYIACLNNQMQLIQCALVGNGTCFSASLDLREVVEKPILYHARFVVLAHNHPASLSKPSAEDLAATHKLYHLLQSLGITLVDHIVVGIDGARSMKQTGYFSGLT